MAEGKEIDLWPLFVAGAVTAAGAATFWWIHKTLTQGGKQKELEEDAELEAIMLSIAATDGAD